MLGDILRVCVHCEVDKVNSGDPCDTNDDGHETISTHVYADGGDAPASPYGRKCRTWGPVAELVAAILYASTNELTPEGVDHAIGMVVNGHDDVASLILNYAGELDVDPREYLDDDIIAEFSR